jgi:hypothetical protein
MTRDVASSNLAERSDMLVNRMLWDLRNRQTYVNAKGYVLVKLPEHPAASHNTIALHRVVMENKIGRGCRCELCREANADKMRRYRSTA